MLTITDLCKQIGCRSSPVNESLTMQTWCNSYQIKMDFTYWGSFKKMATRGHWWVQLSSGLHQSSYQPGHPSFSTFSDLFNHWPVPQINSLNMWQRILNWSFNLTILGSPVLFLQTNACCEGTSVNFMHPKKHENENIQNKEHMYFKIAKSLIFPSFYHWARSLFHLFRMSYRIEEFMR